MLLLALSGQGSVLVKIHEIALNRGKHGGNQNRSGGAGKVHYELLKSDMNETPGYQAFISMQS